MLSAQVPRTTGKNECNRSMTSETEAVQIRLSIFQQNRSFNGAQVYKHQEPSEETPGFVGAAGITSYAFVSARLCLFRRCNVVHRFYRHGPSLVAFSVPILENKLQQARAQGCLILLKDLRLVSEFSAGRSTGLL